MPTDSWKKEQSRFDARRRGCEKDRSKAIRSKKSTKRLRSFPNPRIAPAGSSVLLRKIGEEKFANYTTRKDVEFDEFAAATIKALLVQSAGYEMWVSKKLVKIKK